MEFFFATRRIRRRVKKEAIILLGRFLGFLFFCMMLKKRNVVAWQLFCLCITLLFWFTLGHALFLISHNPEGAVHLKIKLPFFLGLEALLAS